MGFLILFRWWPNTITKSLTLSTPGLVDLLALCDQNRSVGILTIGSWDSDNWKSGDSDNWNYLFKEKEIIPALWMMFLSSLSPKTLYCS